MDSLLLILAIVGGGLALFWVFRKVFKLALVAAIIGVGLLIWYFFIS